MPKSSFEIHVLTVDQICVHPLLVDTMERGNDDADAMIRELVHTSSKFIALERLLDHEVIQNNKKMLIFAGFDYALDCCQSLLHAMNISHLRLDGNTPYAMRKLNVHRFQKQDKHRVFVIAMRAGGRVLLLPQQKLLFSWISTGTRRSWPRQKPGRIESDRPKL